MVDDIGYLSKIISTMQTGISKVLDIIHSRLTYLSNGWTHAEFNLSRTMPLVIDNIRIYVIGLVRTLA